MLVKPIVIDLGWGELKSALINLPDSGFVRNGEAATRRHTLVNQYIAAFREVEGAANGASKGRLRELTANISKWVVPDSQAELRMLVDMQISKLS